MGKLIMPSYIVNYKKYKIDFSKYSYSIIGIIHDFKGFLQVVDMYKNIHEIDKKTTFNFS
jgi:hypothetical protein